MTRLLPVGLLILVALPPLTAAAEPMDDEIAALIANIGQDGCTLVRNGSRLKPKHARAHLRSKARRNARLIDSTEGFIEKIASRSATTGRPYLVRCRSRGEQTAAAWFHARLMERRQS